MKTSTRPAFFLLLSAVICLSAVMSVGAQSGRRPGAESNFNGLTATVPELPAIYTNDFSSLVVPNFRRDLLLPPIFFTNETRKMLYQAISSRMGIRYRFYGIDESGFDCSGFVWRVFQDAGANFDRVAARTLWRQLPEANDEEKIKFGTLVFFNGLRHVGIVRDAFSFYHASRSQGVTLSYFAGYWGKRLTGYRRAPIAFDGQPLPILETE